MTVDKKRPWLAVLATWGRTLSLAVGMSVAGWFIGQGIASYAELTNMFELRRIEVRGTQILHKAEVIDAMQVPVTGSIFDVQLDDIQSRLEQLNYIAGVRLGRLFPHTLFVDVVENQPLAYIQAPEYYLMSMEGLALPLPHGKFEVALPTISGIDNALECLDNGTIRGHLQLGQAWEMLANIKRRYPDIYNDLSEMVFDGTDGITLYLSKSSTAVKLGSDQLNERIALLDAFLKTVRGIQRLDQYAYIDLRYKQQIVVKERV